MPSRECFQQSTGVTKIWRDQAFRTRTADRRQDAQRSRPLALVAPEAGKTHSGAKFECSSVLLVGHGTASRHTPSTRHVCPCV